MASITAIASYQGWKKITACKTLIQSEGRNENNTVLLMEKNLQPVTNNFTVTHSQEKRSNALNHEKFSLYSN